MAAELVGAFTEPGQTVYDPFSGAGTIALEAWLARRHVIANDLNPYAFLLTKAKLHPYLSAQDALRDMERLAPIAHRTAKSLENSIIPKWVKEFFHQWTLREILGWTSVLKEEGKVFLLSCLMGILHHQRPGFLSFPSSHTVPYLRTKKFPRSLFPQFYGYRNVKDRLEAKVIRAFKRIPQLDHSIRRRVCRISADNISPAEGVDAIITSPPYMHQLDYGRDNRLRLWFLGAEDWKWLDKQISPGELEFLNLMRRCFRLWLSVLRPHRKCVLVVGDVNCRTFSEPLPMVLARIAVEEIGGYRIVCRHTEPIPDERRVRRGKAGSSSETVLVLQRRS